MCFLFKRYNEISLLSGGIFFSLFFELLVIIAFAIYSVEKCATKVFIKMMVNWISSSNEGKDVGRK